MTGRSGSDRSSVSMLANEIGSPGTRLMLTGKGGSSFFTDPEGFNGVFRVPVVEREWRYVVKRKPEKLGQPLAKVLQPKVFRILGTPPSNRPHLP